MWQEHGLNVTRGGFLPLLRGTGESERRRKVGIPCEGGAHGGLKGAPRGWGGPGGAGGQDGPEGTGKGRGLWEWQVPLQAVPLKSSVKSAVGMTAN